MDETLYQVYFDAKFNDAEDDPTVMRWLSKHLETDAPDLFISQLHHAATKGDVNDVDNLLIHGCDVNATLKNGVTPLHAATFAGHNDVIMRLVRAHGVNVNATASSNVASLHIAVYMQNPVAVETLVNGGADVNVTDVLSRTPLHFAVQNKSAPITSFIASNKRTNLNAVDNNGSTPLHYAAMLNAGDLASILLSRPETDVTVVDNNGATPLDVAYQHRADGVIKALTQC